MKTNIALLSLGLALVGSTVRADNVGEARMVSYIKYNDSSTTATNHMMFLDLKLNVNGEIDPLAPSFDNEIPSHGHYDYKISGTIEDGSGKCKFSTLWYQENGPLKTTKQLLDSGVDAHPQWNRIKLCSGLVLNFESVRKLLIPGSSQPVSVFANGISTAIAKGTLTITEAPKQAPVKDDSNDPWHRDH